MGTVLFIVGLFVVIQFGCHMEAKSLGETRKQRRQAKAAREKNRLFWSIRDLEKEVLGIDWTEK